MFKQVRIILFIGIVCVLFQCVSKETEGPSPPKEPREEKESFVLESGIQIQLVASEPMVQDPVVITFDEDGRMWVVEMRGFMPDIDGNGEKNPVGRISVLEDKNGDGLMDASTIYIDSLVMPRGLAVVSGGALVVEHEALWLTEDLNHDLRADRKTLIDPDYAGSAMPEHSGNGLLRGIDNWYYNAKSRFRYKLIEGKWMRDSTEFRGQWGISHDDEGRLYYNYNWSQLHADLIPPNYIGQNKNHTPTSGIDHGLTLDRRVYPIRSNPAVNRGYIPGTLDQEGRLIEFTAACSPFYYRGAGFSKVYDHNVFVCEPSGNLIKRNVTKHDGSYVAAFDPHPGEEFLASTDERFRPVFITAGPDGALYIADMYRGLVQHGAYVTPYLRDQTLTRKLVQPINRGRIWRVVSDSSRAPGVTKLSDLSSSALIPFLSNPNGWYRDVAQRLLVERNDPAAKQPLIDVVTNEANYPLSRFHALWALEGLNLLTPQLLIQLLDDKDEMIRITALRLLEPFAKSNKMVNQDLSQKMVKLSHGSQKQILQVALSARVMPGNTKIPLLQDIIARNDSSALIRDAVMSSIEDLEFEFLRRLAENNLWKSASPDHEIFIEMLTSAIVKNRDPRELGSLLSMLSATDSYSDWMQRTILTGLSIHGSSFKQKPVRLTNAPKLFVRKKHSPDSTRIQSLANMFEWPGHQPDTSKHQQQSTLDAADLQQFALGRKHYLTTCAGCHGTDGAGLNRFGPPLAGSEWVLGNEKRLTLLILQGLEGPVEVAGKKYDAPDILPVMPSHSTMDDGAIRAIMTYIRNEWGNSASPVGPRMVGKTRHTSQGRVQPWTAAELNELINNEPKATDDQ